MSDQRNFHDAIAQRQKGIGSNSFEVGFEGSYLTK